MSAEIVAQEIVDDLPDTQGEKAGFGALIAFAIVYYVIGSLVLCKQLSKSSAEDIVAEVSESYDPGLNTFSARDINQVRRRVRRAAAKLEYDPPSAWQEIVTAEAILRKARSPQAVALCLADTTCVAAVGESS